MDTSELRKLERNIKGVICPLCTERRPDGSCELTEQECPITIYLPRLLEVVSSVQSDRMEDYVEKVRSDICSICRSSLSPSGKCDYREEGHCALDAYLLPIVEIIDGFLSGKAQPVHAG